VTSHSSTPAAVSGTYVLAGTCEHCGTEFRKVVQGQPGGPAKFCTPRCKKRHQDQAWKARKLREDAAALAAAGLCPTPHKRHAFDTEAEAQAFVVAEFPDAELRVYRCACQRYHFSRSASDPAQDAEGAR
jgi:hypothetical protein